MRPASRGPCSAPYEYQKISPLCLGLIEAHGTSTSVGDKTELQVLDAFLREAGAGKQTVGIGSVKSQIGHLRAAAGAAGMIKALLSRSTGPCRPP